MHLSENDVLHGRQMREQIEALKHHADTLPKLCKVAAGHLAIGEDRLIADSDRSLIGTFKQIDAAHEGGLSSAALANDAHDLASGNLEIDAVKHQAPIERLAQSADFDGRASDRLP
jgi:hypothetical protein